MTEKEKLEQCKPLPEPSITKIIDLQLYKNVNIPLYRDPYMSKSEFNLCYKSADVDSGPVYAPFVLATIDADIRNNEEKTNEYNEEDVQSKQTPRKLSHLKAIICNPSTDKDIKTIKKMLKDYFNDRKNT